MAIMEMLMMGKGGSTPLRCWMCALAKG